MEYAQRIAPPNARYDKMLKEFRNNPILFYNNVNSYLQSKLNLKFNIDKVLSDEIETIQDKTVKDSVYNKDAIEFDTRDGAPNAIK